MPTSTGAVLLSLALLAGCGGSDGATATTSAATVATTSATAAPVAVTIHAGVLAAMPFQNRLDVARGLFQVKLFNGTQEPVHVVAVQFVWEGLTTEEAERSNAVPPGGRVDFPVPLAAAECAGDGSVESMPDVSTAVVRLRLVDGSRRDVPVFDVKNFARRLYLQDCARQHVEALVAIEWTDLHEVELDGRPVTEGSLRVTRRAATGAVRVLRVSNTINFTIVREQDGAPGVALELADGAQQTSLPVRFLEGRCDAHALSESSQPFQFVAVVDVGDGVERTFAVVPAPADRLAMRQRVERACALLGEVEFVGEGAPASSVAS